MKLIGIAITPSLTLTAEREIKKVSEQFAGVMVGPLNTSNTRTRFQVAVTDAESGFDFIEKLVGDGLKIEMIPAMEVHR